MFFLTKVGVDEVDEESVVGRVHVFVKKEVAKGGVSEIEFQLIFAFG